MRNLKKVLALVVAVAMIASMGLVASAASYSDVAANASYADAVNLLSNLGIIKGYEDGSFKPANTVTRAEAATMIVRMLGLDDTVETGETMFTDVAADNWASGYVNVAVASGIVNGMGDGTFAPNAEVTYGQIVKMLVCALGYEPVAQANGGWNGGGYILAGSKAGFTKGVSGTADAAASRATVAQLIFNALEVELMDQNTWSTGIIGSTFSKQYGKTVLTEYLDLEKVEAVVTGTYLSNKDFDVADGQKTATLKIKKNSKENYEGISYDDIVYYAGLEHDFVVTDATATTLLGYTVTAYVGENEDDDDAIFAIAAKAGKNSTLTLDTDLIDGFVVEDKLVDGEYVDEYVLNYYKNESAKRTSAAVVTGLVEVINNFTPADSIITAAGIDLAEEVTFLDNDNDGEFEYMFAIKPEETAFDFVVGTAVNDDELWTWTDEDETIDFEIDVEDNTHLYEILKDGVAATPADIEVGDVITVLDMESTVITVYVSSNKVEGMIDEVEDDTFVINGGEYKISPIVLNADAPALTNDDLAAGDDGIFYLNAMNKIVAVDTESSIAGADLVYVIDADEQDGDFGDKSYIVKVVTTSGEIKVLTIKAKKVSINGEGENAANEDYKAEDLYNEVVAYDEGIAKIKTTAAGEISAIYFPDYNAKDFVTDDTYDTDGDDKAKEYNEVRNTYGVLDITSDVLVFHKDTREADLEDAITVTTVADLFVDGSSYSFKAYGEFEEVPEVLVAYDAKVALDSEAPVMVVTKVVKTIADEEETWKLTGVVAGETVQVVQDPDDASPDVQPAEVGNVVLYATTAGYATDLKVLFDSNEDGVGSVFAGTEDILADGTLSKDVVTVHYGEITDKSSKTVTIGTEKFYFADEVNVTVVDYTGRKISVTKGGLSSVKTSNTNYYRTAFVKTLAEVEDEISDIVVFVEANVADDAADGE